MALPSLVVNSGAYSIAVLVTITLCAWSIVHIFTKTKDAPFFTDLHMSLAAVSSTCVAILMLGVLHKNSK